MRKKCNCGRWYEGNGDECQVCDGQVKAEPQDLDEPIDFKQAMMESPEVQEYLKRVEKQREKWLMDMAEKHLSKDDLKKLKEFEKLSDYFNNRVNIVFQANRYTADYNNAKIGVIINGEQYWMDEKEAEDY